MNCVHGTVDSTTGICICASGWYDTTEENSTSSILNKCTSQTNPYATNYDQTVSSPFYLNTYFILGCGSAVLSLSIIMICYCCRRKETVASSDSLKSPKDAHSKRRASSFDDVCHRCHNQFLRASPRESSPKAYEESAREAIMKYIRSHSSHCHKKKSSYRSRFQPKREFIM